MSTPLSSPGTQDVRGLSEARFRALFEQFPLSVQIFDPEGNTLATNRSWFRLFGLTMEEVRAFNPLTDPQLSAIRPLLQRGFGGEHVTIPPHPFIPPPASGVQRTEPVWLEVSVFPVSDPETGVQEIIVAHRDVTEEYRAQLGLRAAEAALQEALEEMEMRVKERTAELAAANAALEEEIAEHSRVEEELKRKSSELESIFLALPDLYFRISCDGTILDHRAGHVQGLCIPVDLYRGKRLQEVLPPPIGERMCEAMDEVERTRELVYVEYELPLEGEVHSYEARLLSLPDRQLMAVIRDVSEQRAAEKALKRSEEYFRALIENAHDLTVIVDRTGKFVYQSPSMKRMYGREQGETLGQNAWEFIHPEDAPAAAATLREVIAHPGTTGHIDYRYLHKDGSWRYTEAFGRTLDPESADQGVVINARDVTERKQAELAMQQAKAEAEQANHAKSEFLSRMSHELRTPMNSILGFGQLLARGELRPDQEKGVGHILKAGRHLLNLINEVLDISRIEANHQQLSLEPVHLGTVLDEALALIRPLAAQRGCTLKDFAGTGDLYVHADRQRLVQVMLNLLSNAVKYNRPGGSVAISVEVEDDGACSVAVRDTGPGIPAERIGELFVPFARLGAEQTDVEGTGLGLALSQRLVEAMGGAITVESVPGEGSTFQVELRTAADPLRAIGPARAAPPISAGAAPATILYIEDNLANLTLVESILAARPQYTLRSSLQGRMGLDLAWEHRPDLILLDLHLPDLPGSEVLRQLREDPRTAETPIVVISADATPRRIQQLRSAGCTAYLTKPLDVDEFLQTVDGALDGRRSSVDGGSI
jgi:PAS domain S-box-containing protein